MVNWVHRFMLCALPRALLVFFFSLFAFIILALVTRPNCKYRLALVHNCNAALPLFILCTAWSFTCVIRCGELGAQWSGFGQAQRSVITLGFDYLLFAAACSIAITWRHSSGCCLMAHWPSLHLHPDLLLLLGSQKTQIQHTAAPGLPLTSADQRTRKRTQPGNTNAQYTAVTLAHLSTWYPCLMVASKRKKQ